MSLLHVSRGSARVCRLPGCLAHVISARSDPNRRTTRQPAGVSHALAPCGQPELKEGLVFCPSFHRLRHAPQALKGMMRRAGAAQQNQLCSCMHHLHAAQQGLLLEKKATSLWLSHPGVEMQKFCCVLCWGD